MGKYREVEAHISGLQQLEISNMPEIQSMDLEEVIREKLHSAMLSNSVKKLKTPYSLIVEDTGLYLDSLNGYPGPFIKHLLEKIGVGGIYKISECFNDKKAFAKTIFGVYNSETKEINFYSGLVGGKITIPTGEYGFGWDSIFKPAGSEKTFAEMPTIEEKNQYSMRYKALLNLLDGTINSN